MATTYNFTNASLTNVPKPPEFQAYETYPFVRRNIVDLSLRSLDAGEADVGQVINIPANTWVLDVWVRVITAETANGSIDLGYGSDVDYWGNALAIDATGQVATTLHASSTWDAGSINDGDETAQDVTVDNAALGDIVACSLEVDVADLALTAQVTVANNVALQLNNNTGGAIDLASTTYHIYVNKAPMRWQPLYFSAADTIDIKATTDFADVNLDGAKLEVCAIMLKSLDTF
uniref:Putative structural protein n=1 Tax=viral metagenome TaxID=1070528 RepID=A0A6H1ZRU7_9ZZZZ